MKRGPILWTACLCVGSLTAADWPQFLGPGRDGVYPGGDLADSWPREGPRVLWKKKIGEGFSAPVVAEGRLVIFHRIGDEETADCLEAETGKEVWSFRYPTRYADSFGFNGGPRATPSIEGGHVFTFGAEGRLHALNFKDGVKVWSVNTQERFQARKGFFGCACSPLVEGNKLLLNLGGAEKAGIVAFDKETGKMLWSATEHEASYSSPVAAAVNGKRHAFFFTRQGLVDLLPETGEVVFEFPWRARIDASVNAATPLVISDRVFISASYQTGAALLKLKEKEPEKVWSSDESLSNHYATSVHHGGFLFGFDGRQEYGPSLRCVELETGKVRWSEERFGAGTVLRAGERLLILRESGELIFAKASPARYEPLLKAKVLSGTVRAYPALANGRLYARNDQELVAVELRKQSKTD